MDSRPLGDIYDVLIEGVDVKWLIEHGNLAPYEYYAPTLIETDGLRTVAGDYVVSDLEKLMNERAIYGNVIESYKRFAPGERTICYCVSVEHARATARSFNSAGISAEVLSAATPKSLRQKLLDSFRSGSFKVLCNVGIISEGVSIDEVTCCMLLRPTESVALGKKSLIFSLPPLASKKRNTAIVLTSSNGTIPSIPCVAHSKTSKTSIRTNFISASVLDNNRRSRHKCRKGNISNDISLSKSRRYYSTNSFI